MSNARSAGERVRRRQASLSRRHRRERLFRTAGAAAIATGIGFLLLFFASLIGRGAPAFVQTRIALEVELKAELLTVDGRYDPLAADFDAIVRQALWDVLPDVTDRRARRSLARLVSIGAAFEVRDLVERNPGLIGSRQILYVPAAARMDMVIKGKIDAAVPESQRTVSDQELAWIERMREAGIVALRFNSNLFSNGDSREPELAGIRGALIGSLFMMMVTAGLSLPLGIAAAVYLEEFAPRNRWTDLIEVNINNLAAVPSIIFGLLGLAVFIDWLGMPRSAPLVGGLVLSLLTLPIVIISARAAITAIPPSIRQGALAVGASRMQVVFDHVLPLAMPGMLTGGIIGLGRALGETAPLLMIGMVAFIVDVPESMTDPATALPVQIYLWSDSPERAFAEHTAAAIIVLLGFLLLMNLAAVIMRRKLQKRIDL